MTPRSDYEDLRDAVTGLLAKITPLTQEAIRTQIERNRPSFPSVTDDEAARLAAHFESVHCIETGSGHIPHDDRRHAPWLSRARKRIDPYYWERLRAYLIHQECSARVISVLDQETDRVLDHLEDPRRDGPWERGGMVVSQVQSGKARNYVGLACKAADAGYRVIIVIAGNRNRLRNQTQERLDEGLIGWDNSGASGGRERTVGVGRFDRRRRPAAFTNAQKDFNRAAADAFGSPLRNLEEPAVFVIKKNATTLRNLLNWLKAHNRRHDEARIHEPLLVIDDAVDDAPINKKRGGGSKITCQIQELLSLFERRCHVGYTATPDAQISIDPDDKGEAPGNARFPSDFIVKLAPPDNS